jgi:hypothetical protein
MSNGRPWTSDDDAKLRRLNAAGWTDMRIGEDMDRHPDFIRAKRTNSSLQPGQSRVFTAMMARINYRRMARA